MLLICTGTCLFFYIAEPIEDEMWTAILPHGWTSPYGRTRPLFCEIFVIEISK